MAAVVHLSKVGTEANKGWKSTVIAANLKQIEEDLTTNEVNQQQVSNMTGYKRNISLRQGLSDVKMGEGSPICIKLCLKIVEPFQKNVPKGKIAKILKIPQFTVDNIIKRFRESGRQCVYEGQG